MCNSIEPALMIISQEKKAYTYAKVPLKFNDTYYARSVPVWSGEIFRLSYSVTRNAFVYLPTC